MTYDNDNEGWACPECGSPYCHGCLSERDIKCLNLQILERAKADMVCQIASKPYILEKKKSIALDVPRHATYTTEDCIDHGLAIMKRDALKMQKDNE